MAWAGRGRWTPAACLAPALLLASDLATAEPGVHALAKLATDYVYRGYSKGDGEPVQQLNLDYLTGSGWYAGAWLTRLEFDRAGLEAVGYAGLRRALGEALRLDLSVSRYWYDARLFGRSADYEELYAALHYGERATLGIGYAPRPYGYDESVTSLQLELRHPLDDALEFSAGGGYEWAASAYDYDNAWWNAGLSWFAGRFLVLDLRYHGARELNHRPHADAPAGEIGDAAFEHRLVLSLTAGL